MPYLALCGYFIFVVALMRQDPAKDTPVSGALWIPLTWMVILASRLPSQWSGTTVVSASAAYEGGNSLDRTVYVILILLAVITLMSRAVAWSDLFTQNFALISLLVFSLVSVIWSDFPFVSLRRWIRDLGGYLMIVVVMSEDHPLHAAEILLRRLCYLLIPLSVVFIKYFPQWGRAYSPWTGDAYNLGVTTNKNLLGVLCLISGIFFFWDILSRWERRIEPRIHRIILINFLFLGMTLWLLYRADSSTSSVCLLIGCLIVAAVHTRSTLGHPARLKLLIPIAIAIFIILDFGFNIREVGTRLVGRDATFTGRTELWNYLDSLETNWLFGTGYESFWLGPRLESTWQKFNWGPNQAHNGFREIYLNLGMVGLCMLSAFLLGSYRKICDALGIQPKSAVLSLAFWTVLLFYNYTEAAFKTSHVLWFTFVLASASVPVQGQKRTVAAFGKPQSTGVVPGVMAVPRTRGFSTR